MQDMTDPATMISPLLGLLALELFEFLAICAALGPSSVAGVILWTQHRLYQIHLKQQKQQAKLDSARLVIEIDKQYRTDEFRDVFDNVQAGWHDEFDIWENRKHLLRFLYYTNVVCSLHESGVLTKEHMGWFYDGTVIMLDNNDWVHEYMKKNTYTCVFIVRRLADIRKYVPRKPTPRRPLDPST